MVELQILNKVLKDGNDNLLTANDITRDYFNDYIEEYDWIMNHKEKYGNIPDIETFLATFQDFEIINVSESTEYLISTFREEYLYRQIVPVIQNSAELIQTNSYNVVDYLKAELPNLRIVDSSKGVNIIAQAEQRLNEYEETKANPEQHFIPTGFEELDEVIGGFHKGEDLIVLFARSGIGKTWVAMKMLEHSWKMNINVGLIEPEMSASRVGYRFDTLNKNISNTSLIRGKEVQGYSRYIKSLADSEVPFWVAHPKDFQKKVTVSKLKSWVEKENIGILCIDGISYMTDERMQRGDNKTTQLTNISEDLMQLSIDLKVPVIIVVQSNRAGEVNEDLELSNIRDSDGIAYNASTVIAIQQKQEGLQLKLVKARNAKMGTKLIYMWDADLGKFEYIPQPERGEEDEEKAEDLRRRYQDKEEGEY